VATVPDAILLALIAVSATPLPEIETEVIAPALNSPEVPRSTIVLAPFAVAAVVRAFATVPVVTFDPLIADIEAPPPIKLVAVIAFAVKFPEASLATIVDAPLPEAAVVAELGMLVKDAPEPLNVVAVITLPAKDPAALRETIVLAPLASEAVVLAFAIVPDVILLALIAVKATPLPDKLVNVPVVAVTTLPAKLPFASLATIVEAPFAEAAVVAEFGMLVSPEPDPVNEAAVIAPAVNSPEVPRRTMVDAPFAVAAVVLAFAMVPEAILEALIAVKPIPFPDTAPPLRVVMLTTFAVNEPLVSRATIVLAPLADAAVVLSLAIVPLVMFDALIAVRDTPLPDILVNVPVVPVTTFPAKEPLASLKTKVLAPLAAEPVVRALAIVPVETLEALIALMAAPSPVNEAPVIAPAANSPDVPRSTIVDAPLAVAAVVRALAMVPVDTLEALIAVKAEPFPDTEVKVPAFAVKLPDASRATIVLAPLAEAAVVRAFDMVPVEILLALMSVRPAPLPL
jgi:hypothetical protein